MKSVTYLESLEQWEKIAQTPVDQRVEEVIIGTAMTSRFSQNTFEQALELALKARELGLKTFFEWDVLATQSSFEQTLKECQKISWSVFDAVRVQDPGAMEWMRENHPEVKLHLILERGNHNLLGIKRWVGLYREQCTRVVLSLELSKEKLKDAIDALRSQNVEVEFLILGRILLFYTPRNLLSVPYFDHDEPETLSYTQRPKEAIGHSEESPHSGFPLLENAHGTFMFNTKDHCLLENIAELKQLGLASARIDLRFGASAELLPNFVSLVKNFEEEAAANLRQLWPAKVIRGYYNVNRSDRLFSKLKNARTQRRDESFAAEVVDAIKDSHLGLIVKHKKRPVKLGQNLKVLTPDGKHKSIKLNHIWDAQGIALESVEHDQVFFTKWTSGVSLKSMAYFDDEQS